MLTRSLSFISISTCAAALVLSGCGTTVIPPSGIQAPSPAVQAVGVQVNGVAPNRALTVQFNEAMDPSTINGNTVTVTDSAGTHATGQVTYDANFDIASFNPKPALKQSASYTLTVNTGAKSTQEVPLGSAYTYQFTTRNSQDSSPIYVKSVTPSPNASCVKSSSLITITFSEGADVNTINSSDIVISGQGGTLIPAKLGYDAATATATLTPGGNMPAGAITVTVKNVADAAGVAMTSPYSWSFSTSCSGSGGGGGTPGNLQYKAPLVTQGSAPVVKGHIMIDTAGMITVQLAGAQPSTGYLVQFCPAEDTNVVGNSSVPCTVIFQSVMTDSSGNASTTAKFPENGPLAGDFLLCSGNCSKTEYLTSLIPGASNETFMATLVPETAVGNTTSYTAQDPLSSGTVTYANGSLKFVVKGASPNATYRASESETYFIHSSGTYTAGTVSTDSSGNGATTTTLTPLGGDMFAVERENAQSAGFIGGFNVPH